MREYEVMLVINPNLEEEARNQLLERVSGWLTHGEGEEAKPQIHHWGMRHLAYPIKNNGEGYYALYEATLDPQRLGQLERDMLYVNDILRHMVVRKEQ